MHYLKKIIPALSIVLHVANINAHPAAVVEDRSIISNSDARTVHSSPNKMSNKIAYNSFDNNLYPANAQNTLNDDEIVDLDSVPKEYKPEVMVERKPSSQTSNEISNQNQQTYNQELVIPNSNQMPPSAASIKAWNEPQAIQPSRSTLKELESMPLNARMRRIENILEAQKTASIDSRITAMQEEVQRLRGVVETQKHAFEKTLEQQKLLVDDLERRLSSNTGGSVKAADGATVAKTNYQDDKLNQQDLYTQAYSNIKTKNYTKAITLFNKYLADYPNGLFGANSNYWLGEVYMIQSQYDKALVAFDNVLNKYAKNSKSADALYKKGLVHIYLKDFKQAKTYLSAVKTQYKDSTAARLADKELQTIEKISGA